MEFMRNTLLESQICEAIKKTRKIRFRYKDEMSYRDFNPYLVYESTKHNILVYGTQTHQDNKSLLPEVPRNFEVELIHNFSMLDTTFKADVNLHSSTHENSLRVICATDKP